MGLNSYLKKRQETPVLEGAALMHPNLRVTCHQLTKYLDEDAK